MKRDPAFRAAAAGAVLAAGLMGCDEKIVSQADVTPPRVEIASPEAGGSVSGVSFRVEVDATDDQDMDRVELRVNGGPLVTDSAIPFSFVLVTLADSAGTQLAISAEAFDAAGNSATTSASVTVSARTLRQLTTVPQSDMNPAWSPDGGRIAFQANRNGAQFDLWVMDSDGANPARLTQNVNEDRNPAWSPDGEWIAFDSDRAGTFDIWLLPLATGEADASALTFGTNDDIQPVWTPGGVDLYFASDRGSSGDFDIWRMPATGTGGDAVQVTAFPADDTAPALSSDGRRLAFVSPLDFSTGHVYTKETGVTGVTPLTGDPGITEADPAWAPGTKLVIFSRDEGLDSNLWIQAPGGTTPAQVTFGSGTVGDGGAAWSPDGTRIAFHSDRSGNLDIWVLE